MASTVKKGLSATICLLSQASSPFCIIRRHFRQKFGKTVWSPICFALLATALDCPGLPWISLDCQAGRGGWAFAAFYFFNSRTIFQILRKKKEHMMIWIRTWLLFDSIWSRRWMIWIFSETASTILRCIPRAFNITKSFHLNKYKDLFAFNITKSFHSSSKFDKRWKLTNCNLFQFSWKAALQKFKLTFVPP